MQVYTEIYNECCDNNVGEMLQLYLSAYELAMVLRGDGERLLRGLFATALRRIDFRRVADEYTCARRRVQLLRAIFLQDDECLRLPSSALARIFVLSLCVHETAVRELMTSERYCDDLAQEISNEVLARRSLRRRTVGQKSKRVCC